MANNNETTIQNPFSTNDTAGQKEKQKQPNYGELVEVDSQQPNYGELVEVKKGLGGHVKDFTTSLALGAASLPDIAIGIGDLYSGGRLGKAVEDSGVYTPGSGSDYWRDKKTINSKSQQQEFDAAEGIIDKTKVALSNPSMIINAVGESLAPMALGGLAGRAINVASKGKVGAVVAGALGEGTVMAGAQAENIRQETDDGLLTNGQVGAALATGVAGTAFGYLGGRIAKKLGFADADSMMANGVRREAVDEAVKDIPFSSIPKSILAGAITEGVLEELPQSVSEQALQNIALGKPWHENLDDAIVMGTLAGMAMGGGINAYTSTNKYLGQDRPEDNTGAQNNGEPNLPMLPGGNGALEGEFIPGQRGQATTDAQGRTTYEYDQFSTDADNRLTNNGINPNNGFNPGDTTGPGSDNPINPNNPPAPNGNYFDSDQAFDDLLNEVPPLNQTPSQRMGLNPNEGPLSTAAALAVDTGVSSQMQQAAAAAAQNENNNSPLTTAAGLLNAPNENSSSNEPGTGSSNNGPLGETSNSQLRETSGSISTVANSNADDSKGNNLERPGDTALLSNTIGNDGKDTSGRKDSVNSVSGIGEPSQAAPGQSGRNNLNTIGNNSVLSGENEAAATSSSTIGTTAGDSQNRTVEPILGADGKNKWFGNQDKAQAFLDKKNLGNDYQVVQDGKRFEIQPKVQAPVQDKTAPVQAPVQAKISDMEQQLATEKSVPKKAQIRKQIAELQNGLADQAQSEVSLYQPRKTTVENHQENFAKMDQAVDEINNVRQRMREANPEIFTAENDRVRETHGLTNARVTAIADEIESSGSYELSDREYGKVKNNPNYKIDYNPKTFTGKVVAVKDQHSGEWLGNNKQSDLDNAAHEAASSTMNDLPEPTQAQIEAGNYKKGHIKVHGLNIAVENPRGSERRGTDPDGKEWAHTMSDHYGYLKRTVGADNENIDTYIGRNPESEQVFIVDQIDQKTGGFDEHKVMMGFNSQEDAIQAYSSNFDKGWKVGPVRAMNKDEFKSWLKDGDTKKPAGGTLTNEGTKEAPRTTETALDEKQVKASYGDSLESVMSDVETLGDDFTIDLHSVPKKRNALKNPNYHAVQHENGRVEILGMKHPATGKWVGKVPTEDKAPVQDSPAPAQAPVQEQNKDIKSNSPGKPDSSSKAQSLNIQIQSDSGLVHSIPAKLMDQVHKLGDVVSDLVSMKTAGVKTNVLYGKQLLAKIAKLNPDVQVHIVSDLNLIKDNTIRAGLVDGGYYVPAQKTSYIYPKSDAWESSVLELVNHELVHSVSEQIIFDGLIPQKHNQKLNNIINEIGSYLFENSDLLSENVTNRLGYAFNTNPQHEVLAIGIAETEVRNSLKNILGNDGLSDLDGIFTAIIEQFGNSNEQRKQSSNTGNGEKILHGAVSGTNTRSAGKLQDIPAGTERSKKHKRSIRDDQTDLSTGEKQQGLDGQSDQGDTPEDAIKKAGKLYSYAGQSSLGIDSSKLNQAFSMMKQGVYSELIRKETGWFLGYDKKWRYEINDRNASLKYSGKRASTIASNAKRNLGKDDLVLADVFNHDELFKAYPQLKNIKFEISDDNLFAGGYDPHSNTMSIDTGSSSEEMLSTVLHEMQHAIQDVEGFARGGNSFEFLQTDGVVSYAERNPFENEFQEALLKFQGTPEYDRIQNEMIQAMISDDAEKSTVAYNKMQNFIKKNGLSDLQDRMNAWDSKNSPSAKYNRLAGEVESRDVEARKNLSDHERLNQKPYESQGIPHEDVIVRFNNDAAQRTDTTAQQVRQKLEQRYGKNLIAKLQREGKLEILDTHSEAGAEGWYQNGKVTLVADALTDDSIIPTFLHELGGHAGFQNMMSKEKYSELMAMFDDLVKRGHPMAMAAKELADRENDTNRQQLEYLPYLLTLTSTMQTTNALQRNAVQRFIDRLVSVVKAWAFDRLGINLNLTPNDIVALAERMIDKSVLYQAQQSNLGMYFSEGIASVFNDAFTITQSEQERIAKDIDNLIGSLVSRPEPIKMKMPPILLALNGVNGLSVQDLSLHLDRFTLRKMMGKVDGKQDVSHQLTLEQVKRLYSEIVNPAVVLKSNTTGGLVVVTAMQDGAGSPIISAIHLEKKDRRYVINDIASAYGRSNYEAWISKQAGNIVYINEKSPVLVRSVPTQLRKMVHQNKTSNQSVLSHEDVVNFYEHSGQPLYSRRVNDMKAMLNGIASNMNKQGAKQLKEQAALKFKDSLGYLLQGLGRRQLVEVYSKILPQLDKYNMLAAQMDADKNEAAAKADELVVRWSKIKDEQQLAELMHGATLAKIDPDKPYVSGDSVSRYKGLRDEFRSLSPEAQQMYRDARDAYKKHHQDVLGAIKERIMRASINSAKKADLMQQMDSNFFHGLKGVYFPLSRFGKFVVIVRKSNGEVESVNRAETLNEAEALRKELINMFPGSNVEKVIRDKQFNASRDMVGRGFMSDLFNELDNFGLEASKQAELEDILGQLYLSSLPDLSWAKHGIHRKGTAGFSQDARRAFAQNMFHGAGYLAKLRYADGMIAQLEEMQKHADLHKNDTDYDQPVAQAVIDEMNKRHESLMSPDSNPLSSALTSLGFVYFLGLSVASGAVNLMQTVLVAYPQMGAKWGFDKAGKELRIAAGQSIKGRNDISKSLSGDELKAYNEAVRRGVIDVTQAHDLAGIAQGEDSGVMWKLRPIMRWASFFFHHAERFNREVTFVAAYRLAKQAGSKHDQAFDQAMKATYDGHFDYSSGNRPRIMQGNVAKVILLFKQFGQNMVYTMIRSLHQSFKAETPTARKEARRALGGIMASHAVFAGTMGLPLVSVLLGLISFLGGDDDDPWDAETALKNNLSDVIGVTATDVLMRGVSRLTPWDISGRVSINNLIIPQTRDGLEGENAAQAYMTAALGPIGGIVVNTLKGFSEMADGHGMRGIETMVPTFLRGPMRALRFADEGAQDKTGVSIKDDVGAAAIFGQALGFAPSEVRLATEGRSAVYKMQKRLDERRSSLLNKFARAKMQNDDEQMTEVWNEIQEFNQANPSRRINKIQAMQGYRSRQKRIDHAENGMVVSRKKRDDMDEGRFAFAD